MSASWAGRVGTDHPRAHVRTHRGALPCAMPLPPRQRAPVRVVFAAKTWTPPATRDERFAALRWIAAIATLVEGHWRSLLRMPRVDDLTCGMSALWRPLQAMLHVEILMTYACTYDPAIGPGSCEAPGCCSVVRPHHAVAYTAGVAGGVVAKESPRQSEPGAWNWFEVADVTDQEFYRMKLYAHAVLGAGYRNVEPTSYRCSGQSLFGIDSTRSWRYYIRHPVVYADWSQYTSCVADSVFIDSDDTSRARAMCADFQTRIGAPIRFVDDDVQAGLLTPSEAASVPQTEAAYRPPHVHIEYVTPAAVMPYARLVAVERAEVIATNLMGSVLADVFAEDIPHSVDATIAEARAAFEAAQAAEAAAAAKEGRPVRVPSDRQRRQAERGPPIDPAASAALTGAFDLHDYIRAKLRLWSQATQEILDAQQAVRLAGGGGGGEGPSDRVRAIAEANPLVTLQHTCAGVGLSPPKEFTCCEVVAAILQFGGVIRTGINPRTTLLNNIHRQLLRSNRLRSPWQNVLYAEVIAPTTTARRFDQVLPTRT